MHLKRCRNFPDPVIDVDTRIEDAAQMLKTIYIVKLTLVYLDNSCLVRDSSDSYDFSVF